MSVVGKWLLWLLLGVSALALAATVVLVVLEETWRESRELYGRDAFLEGSIGTELAPLPELQALPAIFPELFQPRGPEAGDWIEQYGFLRRGGAGALPVGFTVSRFRPRSAAPSPVEFVGLGCAGCHTSDFDTGSGTAVRVEGAANQALNVLAWFEAFRTAILAREEPPGAPGEETPYRLTVGSIVEHVEGELGWLEEQMIGVWLLAIRKAFEGGSERRDDPYPAETLLDAHFQPAGPGRTNPFNSLVTGVLKRPSFGLHASRPNRGFSRIPAVYNLRHRRWGQYDGGIGDLVGRSALAALTIGATVENLAHPEIAHNVREATLWLRTLDGPAWADFFPDVPVDAAQAERGAAVYEEHCFGCHGKPTADGAGWEDGPRTQEVIPVEEIGTDPERAEIRHSPRLAERLYAMFSDEYSERYGRQHPLAFAREEIRPGPAGSTRGYVAGPIDSAFARAPFLHNGSVPTLDELIHLRERRTAFVRGRDAYGSDPVGLVVGAPESGPGEFVFDATELGNSNHGHDYPWPPDHPDYDREALLDLLEYRKTL